MGGKKKFIIGGLIIAGAIVYLIYSGARTTMVYYFTVSELHEKGPAIYNQGIRVGGKLAPGTLNWDGTSTDIDFYLTDEGKEAPVVKVVYSGVVPDGLKTATEVVVEGEMTPAGYFQARNLFVKCPSKYEAEKGKEGLDHG